MKTLGAAFRAVIGLFIDDGAFALQIIAVIILAVLSAMLMPDVLLAAGAILLSGCLGTLFANVAVRRARQS
jgi:hypothetical protein